MSEKIPSLKEFQALFVDGNFGCKVAYPEKWIQAYEAYAALLSEREQGWIPVETPPAEFASVWAEDANQSYSECYYAGNGEWVSYKGLPWFDAKSIVRYMKLPFYTTQEGATK